MKTFTDNPIAPQTAAKVRVFWTNHGYFSQEEFETVPEAYLYGVGKCFEFSLHCDGDILVAWGPISGLRTYERWAETEIREWRREHHRKTLAEAR